MMARTTLHPKSEPTEASGAARNRRQRRPGKTRMQLWLLSRRRTWKNSFGGRCSVYLLGSRISPVTPQHYEPLGPSPPGINCEFLSARSSFFGPLPDRSTMQMLFPFSRIFRSLICSPVGSLPGQPRLVSKPGGGIKPRTIRSHPQGPYLCGLAGWQAWPRAQPNSLT